jgi:glycerol-3-phosphate dehydrogenase (NAD(P)+)
MSNIAIVSAGAFGTALSYVLAGNNHHIKLHIGHTEIDTYQVIKKCCVNATYLPGVLLDKNLIYPTMDLAEAVRGAEFVLLTVPAQHARQMIVALKPYLDPKVIVILTSKGFIEGGTQLSEIMAQELPEKKVCGLYGIMFAKLITLANGFSSMSIASPDKEVAKTVANLFRFQKSDKFHICLSNDLRGTEFGGAMKNVYAITLGIFDGYCEETTSKLGEDEKYWAKTSRYSLINLCMMEFVRFGLAHGARIHTLLGASGIGDIQAGTSEASRNYLFGRWSARLELSDKTELANKTERAPELHEGYDTVRAAMELSRKYSFNAPILNATYDILFRSKNIKDIVPSLLHNLGVSDVNEEEKLNKDIIASIKNTRIPPSPKIDRRKTAFVSYRFSHQGEKYIKLLISVCEFYNIEVSTGVATGPQKANTTVPDMIQTKIKAANLYFAILFNV